jgi:hypothetical protein
MIFAPVIGTLPICDKSPIREAKREKNRRLFDRLGQQTIADILTSYQHRPRALRAAAELVAHEEELKQQQERLEHLQAMQAMVQKYDDLQAWRTESLNPALAQMDEQLKWLTTMVNDLHTTVRDISGKLGGLALILERRLEAVEEGLELDAGDDAALAEARQRGRDFLAATEKEVAVLSAQTFKKQDA